MATTARPRASAARLAEPRPADVLVAFGITGDLARVMTFRSLYRLERRGLLDCPIVGVAVDDWTADDLREHARAAIAAGEPVDDATFERFAARLSYVQGDFGDAGTFERLAAVLGDVRQPVFYLEIPPFLFGNVVAGLAAAGLTENARVVVEKPFGHDLASARELNEQIHEHIDESQLYRVDHFLGKMGLAEIIYLRFANTTFEPIWNRNHVSAVRITMAEDFGVDDRGHFYDPVGALRDVVVNHLMQVVGATAMEPPAGGGPGVLKDALCGAFRAMPDEGVDPEQMPMDVIFPGTAADEPAPYEVLLAAAMRGNSARFTRQDGVEEAWRVLQPLLDAPPRVHPYAKGTWGPPAADGLIAGHGSWHEPWVPA